MDTYSNLALFSARTIPWQASMKAPVEESGLQSFRSSGTPSSDAYNCVDTSQTRENTTVRVPYTSFTYTSTPPGSQSKYATLLARRRSRCTHRQTYTFTDSTPPIPTPTPEQLAEARLSGSEFSFVRSADTFNPDPYVPARSRRAREKWYPYPPGSPRDHSPPLGNKGERINSTAIFPVTWPYLLLVKVKEARRK